MLAPNGQGVSVWVHNATYGGRTITPSEYVKLCCGAPQNTVPLEIWGQGSGFSRIPDGLDFASGTIEEASLLRWGEMDLEDPTSRDFQEFNRKLGEAEADGWLLANNPRIKTAIWYGPEPLPTTGRGAQLTRLLASHGIQYQLVIP